jgi:hypothetical protein
MKLYEATKRYGSTTYIGIILVNKEDNMVLSTVLSTNRPENAYLSGIERAVSHIHNNKLEDGNLIVYGQKLREDQPLTSDYIEKFMTGGKVILNNKELTNKDNRCMMLVRQELNRATKQYDSNYKGRK